ncbi:MAG: class I SAM-dependent methyltransferase [Pseudomonadota bacterium]
MDPETLDFYSLKAADYAEFVGDAAHSPELAKFIDGLSSDAETLDFGCGHGWAAAALRDAGHQITAVDGSAGLAAEAKDRYGVDVKVMSFDAFNERSAYDGLWVSFSLLHDTREAMPKHLARLRRAARPNALLYLGLKEGEGEARDSHGRLYTYFAEPEIRLALSNNGWGQIDLERTVLMGMAGAEEPCLHVFARAQ